MIRELFINITILVCAYFVIHQLFKDLNLSIYSSIKDRIYYGIANGIVGLLLLLFHFPISTGIYIDLRYLPIVFAAFYGGWASALIATIIVYSGRLLIYDEFHIQLVLIQLTLFVTAGFCAFIAMFKLRNWMKMFLMLTAVSITNLYIAYVITIHDESVNILSLYRDYILAIWIGGGIGFYLISYLRRVSLFESKYRMIAENTSDFILVLNEQMRVTYCSPSCDKYLGYRLNDLNGEGQLIKTVHPDNQLMVVDALERKQAAKVQCRVRNKIGDWVDLEANIMPIYKRSSSIEGLVIISRDISERKQEEQLLIKSEKLSIVGELASGVAHEIRNPLTTLKGFLQFMKADFPDPMYADLMYSELERIELITNEFLMLAKPHLVHFQHNDLKSLLEQVLPLINSQAIMNDIEIITKIEPDLPLLFCEANQIKQVFINLLKNAIEAMPTGGIVRISIYRENSTEINISITDQGEGIAPERIPYLGQPFYSLKEKGTGLGLMVCSKIVKEHRGEMEFHSELGKGTCVNITFPLTTAE